MERALGLDRKKGSAMTDAEVFDPNRIYELDIKDVDYLRDGNLTLQARIYQPQGRGPFPALIYLHGGAWSSNDRTTNPGVPRGVAGSGVVVCSIDFRQGADYPFPSSMIDLNYAIRWLKIHAPEFNGVPGAVGCMGSSSGGHLTLLAAMRPRDPRYTILPFAEAPDLDGTLGYAISCMGVIDPYARYLNAKKDGNEGMVARHDAYFLTEDAQIDANPYQILERKESLQLPPALVVQGTADTTSPKQMVESFAKMYRAAGGQLELAQFEGMPHGIWDWPEDDAKRAIQTIAAFIAKRVSAVAA
jgi:acetyl esterase/lipase